MKKVNVGVIGLGTWGEVHVKAFTSIPHANLVAVCDIRHERALYIKEKYHVKKVYTNYEDLVKDKDIDAVTIALPDFLHRDPAVRAAEEGKHVLVEKPLATNIEDAEAIVRAARKAGVKLMVDFHNRWNPPFLHAKQAIEQGELGDVIYIYGRLSDTIYVPTKMLSWASRTNVMWFLGSHLVDITRWLLSRDKPVSVYGIKKEGILKSMGIETPDMICGIIRWSKGAISYLECCWILPETEPKLYDFKYEIIGSSGTIYIDTSHNRCIEKYLQKSYEYPDTLGLFESFGKPRGFAIDSLSHFIDCIIHDKEPIATGEDGLVVTKIICYLLKSIEEMRPLTIS
ncbi:MAG: gfo/Idh/MocA family oxidoreductase [Thermoprotei archaeon]|nr:MAG: gfo/Idh/MocA family oxidoreductase [Thermoprotei archaeon]